MSPARAEPTQMNIMQSSSRAFLNGFGSGVTATISKAGMGVQRLAAAQIMKHRDSVSASAKPQNCRRVVVLGAPRVGKSAILHRFLNHGFEERYEPTREDFHRKLYHIRGESYQVDILDASGERDFPAKRRLSILTGDVFLLVFSVDDRGSFDEARTLHSEITAARAALRGSDPRPRVPVVVFANKADLPEEQRAVSRAEAAREFTALFETSARDGGSLDEAFAALAERGGMPQETGPGHHRRLSIRSYHRRSGDAACGAVHPLARRPSFTTDLKLALAARGGRRSGGARGCRVQ
ncbi:GTP-binding protein Rhes [Trichomycterus rosablanca]|uniref:GTP-binding protein Rhes n=1 Tax=Trichomycterus rosablanca TaxID=2290929 RepID=UPI002F35DD8A